MDGKLYGLPLTFESMILLYNTAVFKELGLNPPTNRAEFEAAAEAIKASGRVPIAYGNVGWQPTNEHLVGMWLNATAGEQAVYEALTGARRWDDPVFVDAINLLTDYIAKKGYFGGSLEDYYSLDWNTMFPMLASGKGGMMTIGTWGFRGATDFFTDNPDDWDWTKMPSMNEGVNQGYDLAIGSTISLNAKSGQSRGRRRSAQLDSMPTPSARPRSRRSSRLASSWCPSSTAPPTSRPTPIPASAASSKTSAR